MRRYERDMSRLLGWIYNMKDISASDESKYFSRDTLIKTIETRNRVEERNYFQKIVWRKKMSYCINIRN